MRNCGTPAFVMTDRGSQFCPNAENGVSEYEKKLAEPGMRRMAFGAGHLQAGGKAERLHEEIRRELPESEAIMSDPIDLFMKRYNCGRPHGPLNWAELETPVQALKRKMQKEDRIVGDQT